ncbi:MAG: SoxR reducing system RseC family protein [Rhodocyclales bacterium]|nr:SoxR reducing system RseC family protein [Rhodocyclales bacterium]
MMECTVQASARVVAIGGAHADLRLSPPAACGGCGAQGVCGGARPRQARFPIAPGVAADDCVTLAMSASQLNRGALAAYLLPAACTLTGALLLAPGGDTLAALGAGLGLAFGIVCLRLLARRRLNAEIRILLPQHELHTLQGETP